MIKLASFDIDGTILPYGENSLDPKILDMFKRLKKKNIITVLCTGRNFATIGNMLNTPNIDYLIGANGAFIYDVKTKETIEEVVLSYEEIKPVLSFTKENNINISVTTNDFVYFRDLEKYRDNWFWKNFLDIIKPLDKLDDSETRIHQVTLRTADSKNRELIEQFLDSLDYLEINSIWSEGLFLARTGVHKAYGLKQLGKKIGIDLSEMIAFGDGSNDFEMIEQVGFGVAMGIASDKVKSVAKGVIGASEDCAVLQKLEDLKII